MTEFVPCGWDEHMENQWSKYVNNFYIKLSKKPNISSEQRNELIQLISANKKVKANAKNCRKNLELIRYRKLFNNDKLKVLTDDERIDNFNVMKQFFLKPSEENSELELDLDFQKSVIEFITEPEKISRTMLSEYFSDKHFFQSGSDMYFNVDKIVHMIRTYPNVKWNYDSIGKISTIPIDLIMDIASDDWDYYAISKCNETINDSIVSTYPNFPWDYESLTENKFITIGYIFANPQIPWNYEELYYRKDLTYKLIFENITNPQIDWNIELLIDRFTLVEWWDVIGDTEKGINHTFPDFPNDLTTMEEILILVKSNIPLNFSTVSSLDGLTMTDVLNNFHLKWDISKLCKNENSFKIEELLNQNTFKLDNSILLRKDITFRIMERIFDEKKVFVKWQYIEQINFFGETSIFEEFERVSNLLSMAKRTIQYANLSNSFEPVKSVDPVEISRIEQQIKRTRIDTPNV